MLLQLGRGPRPQRLRGQGELVTRIEGLPALLMELVDTDDPVEVGRETSYEIRVTNTGTKAETNLVAYASVAVSLQDLIGGHVDAAVADVASSAQLVKQGRLRMLAVTSAIVALANRLRLGAGSVRLRDN